MSISSQLSTFNDGQLTFWFQRERELRRKSSCGFGCLAVFLGELLFKLENCWWRKVARQADNTFDSASPSDRWESDESDVITLAGWLLWASLWMWWWGQVQQGTPGFSLEWGREGEHCDLWGSERERGRKVKMSDIGEVELEGDLRMSPEAADLCRDQQEARDQYHGTHDAPPPRFW